MSLKTFEKLSESFYQNDDVVHVARQLLGKMLITNIGGQLTGGYIVETEAYSWTERGCHAYQGKKTARNAVMFEKGGHAYVYLCYGIHHLFNVVTNRAGIADAVLIRALEPALGVEWMQQRRGENVPQKQLTSGPGKLSDAMGINRIINGKYLTGSEVWIAEAETQVRSSDIASATRIGIDYAGDDAKLPWRFYLRDSLWVSKR